MRKLVGGDDEEMANALDWLIDHNIVYTTFIPRGIRGDVLPDFPVYE
jgi:hypothetical protein